MPSLRRRANVSVPPQGQRSRKAPAPAAPAHQLRLTVVYNEIGIGCKCDKYPLQVVRVPSAHIVLDAYKRHLAGEPQIEYPQPPIIRRAVDHKRR